MLKKARAAVAAGDLDLATQLAEEAQELKVPDSAYGTQDDRPFLVMLQIQRARGRCNSAPSGGACVMQAGGVLPISSGSEPAQGPVGVRADFIRENDTTKNQPAASVAAACQAQQMKSTPPGSGSADPPPDQGVSRGTQLFLAGEDALRQHDVKNAMNLFREAQKYRQELDPPTQQRLQDHLQLAARSATSVTPPGAGAESVPGKADSSVTLLPSTDGTLMK